MNMFGDDSTREPQPTQQRFSQTQLQMAKASEISARPAASEREEQNTGPELFRGRAPGAGTDVAFGVARGK